MKLSSPDYGFAWEQHGSHLSFGLLIFLAVLINILVITAIIWQYIPVMKTHLQTYVSERKVEAEGINEDKIE